MPPRRGSSVASTPFHRIICSGSTKNLKITSGGASIRTSRSTGTRSSLTATATSSSLGALDAMSVLGRRLQARQPLAPEVVEELAQFREALRADAVQAAGAVASLVEQPGVLEHPEVLRDGGA